MRDALVSVVIPTYNRSHCLRRCVDSVLAQTHRHLEVIVIDDGSEDDTGEVVSRAYSDEKRVRYVYQNNKGVASARNAGIALARGKYIAFLDSDDIWKPWKTVLQLTCMAALPDVGMSWTNMAAVDDAGNIIDRMYLKSMYGAYQRFKDSELFSASCPVTQLAPEFEGIVGGASVFYGTIYPQIIVGNLVHTSTTFLRRDRIEKVGGFDERLKYSGEDHDFHLRTCREGPVALIDVSTIDYQVGGADQLTRPEYGFFMASNYLRTMKNALDREGGAVQLPTAVIDSAFAEGYAWAGECLLQMGDARSARKHFWESLKSRPRLSRPLTLWVWSFLPVTVQRFIRRIRGLFGGHLVGAEFPLKTRESARDSQRN
jgi:glycosyltransferase involved in cell wall biosynthesis